MKRRQILKFSLNRTGPGGWAVRDEEGILTLKCPFSCLPSLHWQSSGFLGFSLLTPHSASCPLPAGPWMLVPPVGVDVPAGGHCRRWGRGGAYTCVHVFYVGACVCACACWHVYACDTCVPCMWSWLHLCGEEQRRVQMCGCANLGEVLQAAGSAG